MTDAFPYALIDAKTKNIENVIKVYPGAFSLISHVDDKKKRFLLKINNATISEVKTDDGYNRIQHRMFVNIDDETKEFIRSIEKCILDQVRNTTIKRKLITDNVVNKSFKSNIVDNGTVIKANFAADKTVIFKKDSESSIRWFDNTQLPSELVGVYDQKCVYVALMVNVFWIMDDMTCGISWDVKSLKLDELNEKHAAAAADSHEIDVDVETEEMNFEISI